MENGRAGENGFLEAHYYSSGLRYHPAGLNAQRPGWAPPADAVGFRDEFTLAPGDLVIEFQRRIYKDRRVTWVGVYVRSVDEKLGERENHAGFGLWLLEASIVDARGVVNALSQFAEKSSYPFDADAFSKQARKFLTGYLPDYIQPAMDFLPAFPGVAFATSDLLRTSFYQVVGAVVPESMHLAADQLALLTFSPDVGSTMRALIIVSNVKKHPATGGEVEVIKPDMDPVSALVSMIPSAIKAGKDALQRSDSEREELARALENSASRANDLQNQVGKLSSKLSEASAKIEDISRSVSRRTGDESQKLDQGLVILKLEEIDRKLSRISSSIKPRSTESDIRKKGKSLDWEIALIVFLAIMVLGIVGLGGFAAYKTFFLNASTLANQ
jgi:hypothetical protein